MFCNLTPSSGAGAEPKNPGSRTTLGLPDSVKIFKIGPQQPKFYGCFWCDTLVCTRERMGVKYSISPYIHMYTMSTYT